MRLNAGEGDRRPRKGGGLPLLRGGETRRLGGESPRLLIGGEGELLKTYRIDVVSIEHRVIKSALPSIS